MSQLEHAEVGGAQAELPGAGRIGVVELVEPDELLACLRVPQEVGEHGVLVPVTDRVEAQGGRLRLGVQLWEPEPQRVVGALVVSPHGHLFRYPSIVVRDLGVGVRPHPAQPHVVGVGVEDDDAQLGVRQHLFQQQPQ